MILPIGRMCQFMRQICSSKSHQAAQVLNPNRCRQKPASRQLIILSLKIHYSTMSHTETPHTEHQLLGSLLEEIDKIDSSQGGSSPIARYQCSSAPPALLDADFKLDFDLLDASTFQSPDEEDEYIMEAFSKKENSFARSHQTDLSPTLTYRKMSCDSGLTEHSDSPGFMHNVLREYSPIQDMLGDQQSVAQWARDQHGSRKLQDIFQKQSSHIKNAVFSALSKESLGLMRDRFGNYVVQKIFEKGLPAHKQYLVDVMWGSLSSLSFHSFGCRVVQKKLDYIRAQEQRQIKFIQQITPNILSLIQNQNGNHVIQKCLQTIPHPLLTPLINILSLKVDSLAYHPFGCRVIQKYLQHHSIHPTCQSLLDYLISQCIPLSMCQFGNYIMQYIVTKCPQRGETVAGEFMLHIVELSMNKYASNVMEKAIQAPAANFGMELAEWFVGNARELVQLAKHQFGNYVVQSVVNRAAPQKRDCIRGILRDNVAEISKSQHGRHVMLQIESMRGK